MSQPSLPEESIFLQALEIESAADRAAYLEQACGANPDLRAEVEALLHAHEQAGDLLDLPDKLNETQGATSTDEKVRDDLGFLAPADKPDVLGRLGHYEVLEVLGRGGMGIVLRAFDEKLHRVVAIKVMAAQLATIATARKRFTREAHAAAAVSHDHIVTCHAVDEANGLPYLVMQYVAGLSLQERLDRGGPLELQEILRIGMQTASGLAAAHAQGLIHRDIKPANILLENGVERVKLTDFGLARAAADASLTQSGVIAGTPHYMSPEQAQGEKVTIEGDGGIVITGAGPQEVRLKPGSYKLKAAKDGKPVPLERELASIAKGGREVIKVKLERAPAQAAAKAEKGAFVLLAAGKERRFDTLAEAVQGAGDGDTIEVRGNGPFIVSQPIRIEKNALTIRAGAGFRPVIQMSSNLTTEAPLVLEGLELQRLGQQVARSYRDALVVSFGGRPLHVANCRFREHLVLPCILVETELAVDDVVRNCEFLCPLQFALLFPHGKYVIDNCVAVGVEFGALLLPHHRHDLSVQLTRSTVVAAKAACLQFSVDSPRKLAEEKPKPVRVEASGNIFDATSALLLLDNHSFLAKQKPLQPRDFEAVLRRALAWRDRRNLYSPGSTTLTWGVSQGLPPTRPKNLAEWKRFWGPPDGDAIEGRVHFQGGNLVAKLGDTPEKLTPEDFRLRADSAGYRAGKDGKDLGADVDLVGPGKAYERWKKTPQYQQWLKDTGQMKK